MNNKYKSPAIVFHPGEILKDELDVRNWSINEFARNIGCCESAIEAIIKGENEISPDIAIKIAEALGTSPEIWNNMQESYESFVNVKKLRHYKIFL